MIFDDFWRLYPRKVAKGAARKEWERINPGQGVQDQIARTLAWQVKSPDWQAKGGKYIPHPRTWLHQERWEDEQEIAIEPEKTDRQRNGEYFAGQLRRNTSQVQAQAQAGRRALRIVGGDHEAADESESDIHIQGRP